MPLMPDSYVTSATFNPAGQIELEVLVNTFKPGEYVEISGHATQTGGAFANYYDIKQVLPADSDGNQYVTVTATPIPPQKFYNDEDVTVVLRVAKLWVTVLGQQSKQPSPPTTQPPAAQAAATWGVVKQVADINGGAMYPQSGPSTLGTIPPPPAAGDSPA
jgi:hypothetical protein